MSKAESTGVDAVELVRQLGAYHGCRIEIASDTHGALGKFCVTASDGDRLHQGFGGTVEEAVNNMRRQPVRGSSHNTRTHQA